MQGNNQPIDKGRVTVVAEKYQSGTDQQTGQPIMKNRYATVGRATMWPAKQGATNPNIEIEIDTMPVNTSGPVKMFIFWDSENQNNAAPANNGFNNSQPQGGFNNNQGGFNNQGPAF